MWMDAYVDEILIREHIAEAQRRAARYHQRHGDAPRPARRGVWARVSALLRHGAHPAARARTRLSRASQHP